MRKLFQRLLFMAGYSISLLMLADACYADAGQPAAYIEARVTAPYDSKGTIQLDFGQSIGLRTVAVDAPALNGLLSGLSNGDVLEIGVDDTTNPQHLKSALVATRSTSILSRLVALAIGIVVLFAFGMIATRGNPLLFLIGLDQRYSNSQCQMAFWFFSVMAIYIAALVLRVHVIGLTAILGVAIPTNVLALMGLSALTFGSARFITTQKVSQTSSNSLGPTKSKATRANFLSDLVMNDQCRPDLGDFQMIFLVILAVGIYWVSAFNYLGTLTLTAQTTLPDIDTALLSGVGLGQGAYLVKKLASNPGEG